MDVYEAVSARRSVRGFTDRQVDPQALKRVLTAAARAPSGGNLQPWHIYAVAGNRLAGLKARVAERVAAGDRGDPVEVAAYPSPLRSPYRDRLVESGRIRYGAVGVDHDDLNSRARVRAENWNCYGASTALFYYLDRGMPPPQWADAGIHLQTVMLLLKAEGLDSCPQIAWAEYHRTVAAVIRPAPGHVLYCGVSIGYADPDTAQPRIPRAPLTETVTFLG